MRKMIVVLVAGFLCAAVAMAASVTNDYSWENGGTILGRYGNLTNELNVSVGSDPGTNNENPSHDPWFTVTPHSGSSMLEVTEGPHSGTPQAFVGWVTGLASGDVVTASFYVWDSTDGASPSMRLWGHYNNSVNGIDDYQGSAGGIATYTSGTGEWVQVSHTWTFDDGGGIRNALVIEARIYSTPSTSSSNSTPVWIDDLQVIAPDTATVIVPEVPSPAIWYVAPNSASDGPGTAWSNAFHVIQDAVGTASPGDTILVTNGVYNSGGAVAPGYALTNRICITTNITVQSVNGPEFTFIVGYEDTVSSNGSASVRCALLVSNAVLSGFTLTNGYTMIQGDEEEEDSYNYPMEEEPPSQTDFNGGGVFLDYGGMLSDCIIIGCNAENNGGGVCFDHGGELNNCIIRNNEALQGRGGGLYCDYGGTVNNSLIVENISDYAGGGIYCNGGGSFNNCTVAANKAGYEGGGIFAENAAFKNCIIYHNTAYESSNYDGYGSSYEYCCTMPMPEIDGGEGGESFEVSDYGDPSPGCITNDPSFVNLQGAGYQLRSSSPCLDTGTNGYVVGTTDLTGNSRIINGTVDMGAYESVQLLAITAPLNGTVIYGETLTQNISGTCGPGVVGSLIWTNTANGANGTILAHTTWSISSVAVGFGENMIIVSGTNTAGDIAVDSVGLIRIHEHGGDSLNHYAWTNSPAPAWPYTNWIIAAHTLQDAVDAAVDGDTVWATNGVYSHGGDGGGEHDVSSRVLVAKAVVLRTAGSKTGTIIVGAEGVDESDSIRSVYLGEKAEIHGVTLLDGYAGNHSGGGLYLKNGAMASNCVIKDCFAQNGGGVYISGGNLVDSIVTGNSATNQGGGISCGMSGTVIRCTITTNYAYYGGGIYVSGGSEVTDSVISTNSGGRGAGMYNFDSRVNNCLIENNWSTDEGGGIRGGGSAIISDCTIRGNSTRQSGGGVLCYNNTTLIRCRITENESRESVGGGVYFNSSGYTRNCLIAGNRADAAAGGVYCREGGVVENCTIVSNTALHYGGGVYRNAGGTFRNSIIYDNISNTKSNYDGTVGGYTYCCTTPALGGDSNITSNPLFVDAANTNYRLLATSPCIDKGNNAYMPSSNDLDDTPRPLDGDANRTATVDMGCYEVLNAVADSDDDGLSDGDEVTLYGTSPACDNTDGDAHSDYEEMIADTDGADSSSYFCVTAVSNNSPVTVYFKSSGNRLYTMLGCSNLVSGTWTNVSGAGPTNGVGGADSLQDTNVPAQGPYYRLEVQLP